MMFLKFSSNLDGKSSLTLLNALKRFSTYVIDQILRNKVLSMLRVK